MCRCAPLRQAQRRLYQPMQRRQSALSRARASRGASGTSGFRRRRAGESIPVREKSDGAVRSSSADLRHAIAFGCTLSSYRRRGGSLYPRCSLASMCRATDRIAWCAQVPRWARGAAGAPHLRELRLAHLHLGLHRPRPTRTCVRLTARVCARACARVGVSVREHRAHGMCARHARVQLPRPQLTAAHSQPHRDGRARATSMHRPLTALRTAQYRTRPRPLSLTPRMRTLTRGLSLRTCAAFKSERVRANSFSTASTRSSASRAAACAGACTQWADADAL